MASAKAELVEKLYGHWEKGDFAATEGVFGDDFTMTLGHDFPDAGTREGPEGVAAYMRQFLEPWRKLTIKLEQLEESGIEMETIIDEDEARAKLAASSDPAR